MKKILVTGGSGFIGGHILNLAKNKYEVHTTFFKNKINFNNINSHNIDIADRERTENLLINIKPEIIIHTAAISNADVCEQDRERAQLVNVGATETLATWAMENHARFIFTSTDMVFDGKKGNYRENDPVNPLSFYGQTKVQCEKIIAQLYLNSVIVRVALTYGIGITRHDTFFEIMLSNIKQGKSVTLFDDQFRSPILVNNLAEALLDLAENKFMGTVHLSGGERVSRWDLGLRTCQVFHLPIDKLCKRSMFDFPLAASRPQDISMINDLAKHILKVKLLNVNEGLKRLSEMVAPGI